MRKLASIVTIATSTPIPETDRLDVVTLNGKAWRIVTGRNEFRPGDRAVYFEIDSALPADDERFAFLHERCLRTWSDKHGNILKKAVRIRTIRLKGVISQGLVMPAEAFPELATLAEGDDATGLLKVEHFDEIQEQMRQALDTRSPQGFGRREGNSPAFIPKTDEERIQNLADWPEKLKGIRWEVTEKKDGSSCTFFYSPGNRPDSPFGVCSRNFELKFDETNAWWEAAIHYDVEAKLRAYGREIALQGELVGPGMNGNRDLLQFREFHVFRIWDIGQERIVLEHASRLISSSGTLAGIVKESQIISSDNPLRPEQLQTAFGSLEEVWEYMYPVEKFKLIRLIVSEVKVFRDQIIIDYSPRGLEQLISELPEGQAGETAGSSDELPAAAKEMDLTRLPNGNYREIIPVIMKYDGRKSVIYQPEGALIPLHPATMSPMQKAMVQGLNYARMMEVDGHQTMSDLAREIGIDRTFIYHTLELVNLAPDIVKAIMNGFTPENFTLERLRQVIPDDWTEQRQLYGFPPVK